MRTGDENERLGDDGNLEVDNHVELGIVVFDGQAGCGVQVDAEGVLEEVGVDDDRNKGNTVRNPSAQVNKIVRRETYVEAVK